MSYGKSHPSFVDIFAGCGGLSLGLFAAGWRGLFAIEKDPRAFATLSHNFLGTRGRYHFDWPEWLPKRACSLEEMLSQGGAELARLKGRIDLLAGGPPCQGFSTLGKRVSKDPRNQLFRQYLNVVRILEPKLVLIENVKGICHPFADRELDEEGSQRPTTYANLIHDELRSLEYQVWPSLVYAADFGVPQTRPRFLFIAARMNSLHPNPPNPFDLLKESQTSFLFGKGLNPSSPVTAEQAISDLQTEGRTQVCVENPRFRQGKYGPQKGAYQRLMHGDLNGDLADSHRLANHHPKTVEAFRYYLDTCERGKKLTQQDRGMYVTKKHSVQILHPHKPSPTVTTLPDDLLHYREPRILTVRENARLQSFPDWFYFQGKFTTGGKQRVKECPRYTQVGNAVPPLLAEAVGRSILEFRKKALKQ